MKLSVIGCGYLGAVHAAAMAELGHDVIGIDVDQKKIDALAAGTAPFFEPGLPELLSSGVASGRLRFSTDMADAAGAAVHFVAVGTPQKPGENAADMTYVDSAIDGLLPYLEADSLVVGKSTVPVGTAARLADRIASSGATLAWNPEFLREGFAVKDTISPDRLVYGVPAGEAGAAAKATLDEVYATALAAETPLVVTDYATAELVKVSANAFLATKISFINAIAEIAEVTGAGREGADVLREAAASEADARVQEAAADPHVVADGVGELCDVRAGHLRDLGDRVDERDLGREEGVGRDLHQLGGG
ncbi:UDP-glucose 6-dehydrogenase, partial [Rathayibacter sp. AY1D5]